MFSLTSINRIKTKGMDTKYYPTTWMIKSRGALRGTLGTLLVDRKAVSS